MESVQHYIGIWVVAMSGQNAIASNNYADTGIYYSGDYGINWSQSSITSGFWQIAMSGQNAIASNNYADTGIWFSPYNPCFLKDTPILMENFTYKPIQDIKEGDYTISCFSQKRVKVKEVIKNKVHFSSLHINNRPVKIPKNFFCPDIPSRDIYLSGFHRIVFYSKSKNIKVYKQAFKIDGLQENFIETEEETLKITGEDQLFYYHIRLEDPSDCLVVANLAAESYQE